LQARKEAKRLLSAEPEVKAFSPTFAHARTAFLVEHYKDKAVRTQYNVAKLLTRHFKAIEHTKLAELEDADIKKCLDKLAGTPSEQLHAYRSVRCFLRWCTRPPRRYIKHSPMEGYEPPGKDRKGTRILSDEELKKVWMASEGRPQGVLRLMILWGTRNSETVSMEASWVTGDVLTIPGSHTKNGRDHSIPLLPLAKECVLAMKPSQKHLFHSRWGETHLSVTGLAKAYREAKKRSGVTDWTIRDLRRTFRSNMARLGVSREVSEVLINHAPPVLDEIYDRYDRIAEKREALAKHEAFIHTLVALG
jgi:integrase